MNSKSIKRSPLKDKPLRYAGQYLDKKINDKWVDLTYWIYLPIAVVVITIQEWYRFFNSQPPQPIPATIAAIIVTVIGMYKIYKEMKEIARLKLARDGENIVAEGLLEIVKQGATVLNDIQGENFNIDHVLVSKQGIYLIETKTLSKPQNKDAQITFNREDIYVDGRKIERNPINQVKALSVWLQNLLKDTTGMKFKIHPVILFPGWFTEKMKGGEDIWILNPKALSTFISHEPISLKDDEVHMITFHLSRYVRTFTSK